MPLPDLLMGITIKNKWLSLSLLAIIVPASLLVSFKLIGILKGPLHSETVTLEALSWQLERPSTFMSIDKVMENNYSDSTISVSTVCEVYVYYQDSLTFLGEDGIIFGVNISVMQGLAAIMSVKFYPIDNSSVICISGDSRLVTLSNATMTGLERYAVHETEAYVCADVYDKPCSIALSYVSWVFNEENVEDHQLLITPEVTYFNGTAYRKLVFPIYLGMPIDSGNTINDPNVRVITPGSYMAFAGIYIPSTSGTDDVADFYKIWVQDTQDIEISMQPPFNTNFDLRMYAPNGTEMISSTLGTSTIEHITWTNTYQGYWFIEVRAIAGLGLYNLTVSLFDKLLAVHHCTGTSRHSL
jgi:hypothetical protein